MYVCMYVSVCVCMCQYVYVCLYVSACLCVCVKVCVQNMCIKHTYLSGHIYIYYIYLCMGAYICIFLCLRLDNEPWRGLN